MNWKHAAQQQLRSYPALLIAVENLTRELSLPSAPAAATGQNSSGEPEHCAALSRQELTDALQRTKIRTENIRQAFNVLSPEEQEILSTLYFARKTGAVFDLCEQLHLEQSTVYRRRDKALHRFAQALYGAV